MARRFRHGPEVTSRGPFPSAATGVMASGDPRTWGQRPYPSPLETEGEYRPLALEGKGRSWGGGAPWRPRGWEERGGPQSPPSMEDRGSYGVSEDMRGRRRAWMPPRKEEEDSWGATTSGPQEPPREYWSPKQEGRRGSWEPPRKRARSPPVDEWRRVSLSPPREDTWEPPQKRAWSPPMDKWQRVPLSPPREDSWEPRQKRVQSPPMDEWWRVPLSPPKGRGSTSPNSQTQPSASFSLATHWEPSSSSSRRDSPSNGGHPWVSQERRDGPARESRGRSWESPEPSWESCRDPETPPPANRKATEGRDMGRSKWLEEPGGSSSSSISRHRSRGDPGWETRHGNPVDGSYSVKAGGSRERWSGRGFQGFRRQVDSREWDVRGPKGGQEEGWPRDEGRSVGSPRGSIPRKGRGAKESFRGGFLGPTGGPERCEGERRQAATSGTFFPRLEVVNYWVRCQHIMLKNERDKFVSFCPRPYIADRSSVPPNVNPDMKWLIGKQARTLSTNVRVSLQTQWDVLTMLAPSMALYEMAEAAIEKQERVDPLAVRPLARYLLSFLGSANRGLMQQRCFEVLRAIDPRLQSTVAKMSSPNSGGRLFAEDDVDVLREVIRSLETLPEDPPERNAGRRRKRGRGTLMASHRESAPHFHDGAALSPEPNSGKKAQLADEASLELWHRRFGHANSNTILRLKTDNLVTGIKVDPGEGNDTAECITCLTEWGRKPPCLFPLVTVRNTTVLMDLVHCELYGPFDVPSLTLHRYVLIFVEDFSRFCVTYLMEETSEMHECFVKYLALLRTRAKSLMSTPKAFQLNSAADAVLPHTLHFLEAQGIAHKRDVESIPRKCRTAENEMKSLLEMTRCMLADAMLPEHFWGYAILVATYLQNRLPFKRNKRTSFQDWYGTVPNVKHLRVFGSLFHNWQEPTDDVQYVFIGYVSCKVGYQFMNLETGVTFKRRAQSFDEGKGVKKRGKFLEAVERHGCDIENLAGIIASMTPQPERYTMPAGGETQEEASRPADGNRDEED